MADVEAGPLESFREKLDTARDKIGQSARQSFDGVKENIKTANPYLGEKLEQTETLVKTTVTEFEEKGFCKNYKDFNIELFRPLKRASADVPLLDEIKGTLVLKPEKPEMAFVMWNVLCFWLGVLDFALVFLVSTSLVAAGLSVTALYCFTGYCFAYFFYFVFICTSNKKWMMLGFAALAFYVCLCIFYSYSSFMGGDFLEAVMNLLKTVANTIIAYHAYLLFKGTPEPAAML